MTWSLGETVVVQEVWRDRVWAARPMTVVNDEEDFVVITKRINGGVAGLAERLRYWGLAKKALGVA